MWEGTLPNGVPPTFIIQRITQIYQGCSKVWNLFLRNEDSLSRKIYGLNVQISSVKTQKGLAAATRYYSTSLTSRPRNWFFLNWLRLMGTLPSFIPNSIV